MAKLIEVNENGELVVLRELIDAVTPHERFEVEVWDNVIYARPVHEERPRRGKREAEDWVKSFREWANEPKPPVPDLTDEALHRESMYE